MALDEAVLQRELDRTKSRVFLGKNAAFLGSIMCSMEFIWDENEPTAATDGERFWWNPMWFLSLPEKTRETVLVHELWHPARLHGVRRGTRDPKIWNYACDIRINNDLENEGFSFEQVEWAWKDQKYGTMAEEAIYDALIQSGEEPPTPPWDVGKPQAGDLKESKDGNPQQQINTVVRAIQQAKLAGQAGTIPGEIEKIIDKFLAPIIPWEQALQQFFVDLLDEDYSWRKPNRRHLHQNMYLPSQITDDGRLEHLAYYLDVSGSVSDKDVLRFNSEVKYIKEFFNPEKLTLVQFDHRITSVTEFGPDDPFEKIVVVGRGGTSLVPVREHIHQLKPTAAIIFTDLQVSPMWPLECDTSVIWVGINAAGISVPFGKLIHIRS